MLINIENLPCQYLSSITTKEDLHRKPGIFIFPIVSFDRHCARLLHYVWLLCIRKITEKLSFLCKSSLDKLFFHSVILILPIPFVLLGVIEDNFINFIPSLSTEFHCINECRNTLGTASTTIKNLQCQPKSMG